MSRSRTTEETDKDLDLVPQPVSHDVLTSSEAFPPSAVVLHEDVEIEDEEPERFFETGLGLDALDAINPLEDDDSTNSLTGAQRPLARTMTISVLSTFSYGSALSYRSSGVIYSLKDLCDHVIEKHIWLQMARIVSTSCYSQYRNLVLHRFLILQLRRPGKQDIWLRIDRRAGLGALSLMWKLGKTRAHDTAQLSASKEALVRKARLENVQTFEKAPFLGDFGNYLRVICEELLEYKIWPENCWMFCSLLQEHLGISGDGDYTFGIPIARDTAPLVRTRISERALAHVSPNTIMTALRSAAWTFIPQWQPLSLAKPTGWLSRSIVTFLAKFAYPAQGLDTSHHSQGLMEWITNSSLVARLEKSELHSRIAIHCIETLCRLPEENILQLPNPLILNSDIPDLALRIQSNISSDVQYAALYGLLHVAEIENPSTELFSKLETFFAKSMIKWLEVLSLLGATKNAVVELDKVTIWCENQCRQLQDQKPQKALLRLLLQCCRFTSQYYEVISVSAGHIAHSADASWQKQYCRRSPECLPTVRGASSALDIFLTIRGHIEGVTSVSFSLDGLRVASVSRDETVRIWDALTGQELKVLRGHTKSVTSVSFSSDGFKVVSASEDETVRIWDALTGQELKVLQGHTKSVASVSFSLNGSRVASASEDGTVRIWDTLTGQGLKVLRGHTGSVYSVSFSSEGSSVASASWDKTVRIWNALTGQEIKVLQGHTWPVTSVSFSLDGSRVASASWDETVRIWDTLTGQELKVLRGHTWPVASVSFSSDGSRVASASEDQTLRIWDALNGQELKVLRGHTGPVASVSFSSDGSRVASACRDGTVRIWDALTRQEPKNLQGHTGSVTSFSFSSDGSRVASASEDQTVRIWDAQTGQELKALQGHTGSIASVAFSFDGSRVASASGDQTVRIWDALTGQKLKTLRGHTRAVTSVSFSSDGSRIASVSENETVRIWDAVNWEVISTDESITSNPYPDSFPNLSNISYDCSFAIVKHDDFNHIHLFAGPCGSPHFIAPSCISDIITTWKMSHNQQALAVGMRDGGVLIIQAPQIYHCVEHA
ncbi:WD40-repeat-containing domain protein [Cantharellus anzutake]|uniref:WD40-repeat-containing domain protein n=1 Tax=Cantharellus anzutake TaxID=1750568 RepID=UPI00190672A8|nr:WD40-repeat-containing domain protein [Cantharellus anzutake]KAF8332821.1 WD40-repeat-containing domain protein [Cantharellus anzutake]